MILAKPCQLLRAVTSLFPSRPIRCWRASHLVFREAHHQSIRTKLAGNTRITKKKRMSAAVNEIEVKQADACVKLATAQDEAGKAEPSRPVKKAKVKKPKPMANDPAITMDLHSLSPKLINSEENMAFQKSLFSEYLPYQRFETYELEIVKIASDGSGIGVDKEKPDWYVIVPFTAIGDRVRAKVYSHCKGYSEADLVEVLSAAEGRRAELPCQYAGTCGGCQWQHFDYEKQLSLKAEHLKRAFLYGSRPLLHMIPFDSPERSPLQTKYRTKLTPHFEIKKEQASVPAIGFMMKGRRNILDIEECVLATPAVTEGYQLERQRVAETYSRYPRGATLIIRESIAKDGSTTTVRNHKAQVTQKVGDVQFKYPSGSFFQINGSILPRLTEYVMDEIKSAPGLAEPPRFLLDVYCGSGLFAVACSRAFERVVGVDVSDQSISCASGNAALNGITNCSFKLGNAEIIFDGLEFKGEETAVIIDPPRKGCSEDFIRQLIEFGPTVIVYVSCNPFSQAQDLLQLLTLCGGVTAQAAIASPPTGTVLSQQEIVDLAPEYVSPADVVDEPAWEAFAKTADKAFVKQYKQYLAPPSPTAPAFTYRIVKAKPFDMFPQTKHIESMLTLVKVPLPTLKPIE